MKNNSVLKFALRVSLAQKRPKNAFPAKVKPSWLDDNEENQTWIHAARIGRNRRRGFRLTEDILDEMIQNFYAEENLRPVYFDHLDMMGPEPPASGYLRAMYREKGDLWVFVELTDSAAKVVKEGGYRNASIVFTPNYLNEDKKEVGAYMYSLALLNQPEIRGLKPYALSENCYVYLSEKDDENSDEAYLGKKKEDLNSMTVKNKEEEQEKPESLQEGEEIPSEEAPAEEAGDELEQMLAAILEATGAEELDAAAAIALLRDPRVQDALKSVAEGEGEGALPTEDMVEDDQPSAASEKGEVFAASEVMAALKEIQAENKSLKDKLAKIEEKEAEELVSNAIACGQISPAFKSMALRMAKADRDAFEKELAEIDADPKFKTITKHSLSEVSKTPKEEKSKLSARFDEIIASYDKKRNK